MHVFGWVLCVTLAIACAVVYFTGENRVHELETWLANAPEQHAAYMDSQRAQHQKEIDDLRAQVNGQIDRSISLKDDLATTNRKVAAETVFAQNIASGADEEGPMAAIDEAVLATLSVQAEVDRLRQIRKMQDMH